jgi:3-oxoacyl-[acyl-carrier-protein] synthase III
MSSNDAELALVEVADTAPNSVSRRVAIVGTGHYLPAGTIRNADFAAMGLDTCEEWIFPRTGIRSRHVADATEATSDLAVLAALRALASAQLEASEIDLLLLATATPDSPVPPTSALVLRRLPGCRAAGMDLSAACAGFIFATHTAAAFIRSGLHRRILVIGAETLTRMTDYQDRSTAILFGDGAGAVVMVAAPDSDAEGPGGGGLELLYTNISTTPADAGLIRVEAGGSRNPPTCATIQERSHFLRLDGREVFRRAVGSMTGAAREALAALKLSVEQVRWLIPHQANARIVRAVGEALGVRSGGGVLEDIEEVGNTSAASLPIALDRLRPRINAGELVMLLTFGAGANCGCQVYRAL